METIIVHPKNNEEQKVIKAFLEAFPIWHVKVIQQGF